MINDKLHALEAKLNTVNAKIAQVLSEIRGQTELKVGTINGTDSTDYSRPLQEPHTLGLLRKIETQVERLGEHTKELDKHFPNGHTKKMMNADITVSNNPPHYDGHLTDLLNTQTKL